MRPGTIVYYHPQETQLLSVEKTGPFDGSEALTYFQQSLSKGSVVIAIMPGCHSSQMVVPQYYKNDAIIGDQNAVQ